MAGTAVSARSGPGVTACAVAEVAACAVACITLVLTACGHATPPQRALLLPPPHHRILAFGDSLALGVGASDTSRGFMFLLYRQLLARDPGGQITNYAVGGARVEDVLRYELPRARNEAASDVWLCVGGNDVTHGTAASRFGAQYAALLHAVRRNWPAAKLVVFGVPDVSRSPLFAGESRTRLRDLARRDDELARVAAASGRAAFVDLFLLGPRVVSARDFSADNFHPSDAGYAAIASYAEPVVLGPQLR